MENSDWLRETLVFLIGAVIFLPLVQRLKSTSILGFLAVGLVVGPYGLGLIGDSHEFHPLAELGVVFLLFMIGLELSLARLRLLARYVFGLGGLQVCVTAFILDFVLYGAGIPLPAALILGGALALSSTAFVTEMLLERNELMSRHGRIAFAVLLLQDIAAIPMLVFQKLLVDSGGSTAEAFVTAAASGLAAVIAVIAAGRFVLRPVYNTIARTNNPDLFVAVTLLVILGSGWTMVQGGLTMATGAFLCGVLLAESEYRHQIEADIRPFKGLLLGLFFATVGISLDLGLIVANSLQIAVCVLILIALKSAVMWLLTLGFGLDWRSSVRVGLLLAQGGEFAFVILGTALKVGLIESRIAQIAMAVVGLSMALTPILDWIGRRLPVKTEPSGLPEPGELIEESDFVLIAGFGRVGQTVAKSLAEVGMAFVAVDKNAAQVEACRNLGLPIFFGDASKPGVLERSGAERARAVVIALDREKDSNAAVQALRNSGIDTPIIARSRDLSHRRVLEAKGASAVVPDAVEASLRLGEVVLDILNISEDDAKEALNRLRSDDYALLEGLVHSVVRPEG